MPEVNAYIEQGNRVLGALGYTEHSRGHAVKVAETAGNILDKLGYNQHKIELAKIAGYMHDMLYTLKRSQTASFVKKKIEYWKAVRAWQ